jgi:hypothetical protein
MQQVSQAARLEKSAPGLVAIGCANWNRKQKPRCAALGASEPVKYWEIIADRLHAQGWSYGIAEHFTKHGLLFYIDAHRDGKRFIRYTVNLLTFACCALNVFARGSSVV